MFEHCYARTTRVALWHGQAVLVDQTITYLEMTSPDQLLDGRMPPVEVTIDSVDATALVLIRSTHDRIATPHHWSSLGWSEQQWSDLLARPNRAILDRTRRCRRHRTGAAGDPSRQ